MEQCPNCNGNDSSASHPILQQDFPIIFDLGNYFESASTIRRAHGWSKIFPITKEYGVSLEKPVLEFKQDDIRLGCEQKAEDQLHPQLHSQKLSNGHFLSHTVSLYDMLDDGQAIVFVLMLCNCKSCEVPARVIDTTRMEPFIATVKLIPKTGEAMEMLLSFFPGVTSDFNMRSEFDQCRPSKVLYHSNAIKLESWELIPFNRYETVLNRLVGSPQEEAQRLVDKWLPPAIEKRRMVRPGLESESPHNRRIYLEPDMEIQSSDGKRFHCHQQVLSAQSSGGEITLPLKDGGDKTRVLEVSEDATVTDVFIKWIYFHENNILKSLDFQGLIRLLNLACRFQILKLMGTISKMMMQEMNKDDFYWDNEDMWRLYCVTLTVDKIQIVVRLNQKVKAEVKRRLQMQEQKNGSTLDDNFRCLGATYMDHVFFKLLSELIEKDEGAEAVVVKFL